MKSSLEHSTTLQMSTDQSQWPFEAPRNVACFASRHVFCGESIHAVYHDWDDGSWQFHPDREPVDGDCILVCLESVFRLDPTIGELADLPEGWRAERDPAGGWIRHKAHPYPTFEDDGFYLITVGCFPANYPEAPSEAVRSSVGRGDFVKLVFRFADPDTKAQDYDAERMWVIVNDVDPERETFCGVLDNEPMHGKALPDRDSHHVPSASCPCCRQHLKQCLVPRQALALRISEWTRFWGLRPTLKLLLTSGVNTPGLPALRALNAR
jgi:hypothetical protein